MHHSPVAEPVEKYLGQGIRPNAMRQCVRRAMGAVLPHWVFMSSAPSSTNAVFLTFDDGPHPENTPRVLDVLAETGAKATFFVIGREAEKYPDVVRRIVREGHTVGDHSWSHSDIRTLSTQAFNDELRRARDLLGDLSGVAPRFYRPPRGKVGVWQFITLLRRGYAIVLWNVEGRDCNCQSSEEVQSRFAQWKAKAGDIVLLHDDMGHAPDSAKWIIDQTKSRVPRLAFKAL